MFIYRSLQVHSNIINGEKRTKTQTVTIKGKKGNKSVTINNKSGKKTMKKKLTAKEINCIKKCQYLPGLFKSCTPKC